MVQINLLPPSAKEKRRPKIGLRVNLGPAIFVLVSVILAVVVTWTMLAMHLNAQQKDLAKLDGQLKDLKFTLEKLNNLKQDKEELSRKLEFINQYLKRDILWAKNLNRLSGLIPESIWLKKISLHTIKEDQLEQYERLNIAGAVVSLKGEEMIDLIGRFMTALEKDEVFTQQFSDVKLVSSQRNKFGAVEMMDFNLLCQFRLEKAKSKDGR